MLLKDFFFTLKNIHISFFERKKILKLLRVGLSTLYKFFLLELIIYRFIRKKNLDKVSVARDELFKKDLDFLFDYFNSFRKYHNYATIYEENFNKIKNNKLDILEIGSATGGGVASLYFYFPNSKFITADNNPFRLIYRSERIRNIYIDISSKNILKNFNHYINKKYDLIIEDCSHKAIDQILCFSENFKNLKEGGVYVVEDLNFPEIDEAYNPSNEKVDLKTILKKIESGDQIISKYINEEEIFYIKKNVDNIKFYKTKNKGDYLISGLCEYSEIAFIKKR